jgi:hypothetical protein
MLSNKNSNSIYSKAEKIETHNQFIYVGTKQPTLELLLIDFYENFILQSFIYFDFIPLYLNSEVSFHLCPNAFFWVCVHLRIILILCLDVLFSIPNYTHFVFIIFIIFLIFIFQVFIIFLLYVF